MKITNLKALFWKEWHENARWALLTFLLLSLGLAYTVYRQPSYPSLQQIWSDADLLLTTAVPLVGLALGLLQILPELRRDQWAFLVHRPVSRTTLFFGKVIPGVCLYLLATIAPLLGFALWASSPSHVPAPFDVRFTLVGWAAILSGLPFYFAGLLVALRPARWYGSRALPIVSALIAPWAAFYLTEFWQAALVCALVAVVLMLAAWGSFASSGDYKEQTKPLRFALGLILYPAVLAVGAVVVGLSWSAYRYVSNHPGTEWWHTEYKIDPQGRIFEVAEHGPDITDTDHKTVTVTDLAGHTIAPGVWAKLSQKDELSDMSYLPVTAPAQTYTPSYQRTDRYVSYVDGTNNAEQSGNWYYDSHSRQIVRYEVSGSGAPQISYLGPSGFSRASAQAGQFPVGIPFRDGNGGPNTLRFSNMLYLVNVAPALARLLQAAPGPNGILGTVWSPALLQRQDNSNADQNAAFFVADNRQITVYSWIVDSANSKSPRRLFTTPLPLGGKVDVQVATADLSRFFFWYQDRRPVGADKVVTVGADGHVLKTETFPPSGQRWASVPEKPRSLADNAVFLAFPPAVIPSVAVYATVCSALGWSSAKSVQGSPIDYWRVFLISCLSGFLAALAGWLISRRCGDGRRGQIAWAFGVFWLGGYGVLLLLALRAWPARVPCPNCGRRRVVDHAACEHCGAPFARPVRDGTEIFDVPEPLEALR
jgi:hypothetical protein